MKTMILDKKLDNEFIDSYFFCKYDSEIYHLIINTKDKWCDYHRYTNQDYWITDNQDNTYTLEIPEIDIPAKYLCTSTQDGNQISFYWIPFNLIK